jgi:hypothetical protein
MWISAEGTTLVKEKRQSRQRMSMRTPINRNAFFPRMRIATSRLSEIENWQSVMPFRLYRSSLSDRAHSEMTLSGLFTDSNPALSESGNVDTDLQITSDAGMAAIWHPRSVYFSRLAASRSSWRLQSLRFSSQHWVHGVAKAV